MKELFRKRGTLMEIKLSEEMGKLLAWLSGAAFATIVALIAMAMMRAEFREERQREYNLNMIRLSNEQAKETKGRRR